MAGGIMQLFKGKVAAKALWTYSANLFQDANAAQLAYTKAGSPTNGTNGTLAGVASIGALLLDVTGAVLYQNSNTKASPTWTALTTATGAGTYTGTFNGTVGATTPNVANFTWERVAVGDTLTAAGTTRADALALTKAINHVTTAASGTGVILTASATIGIGGRITVLNDGASAIMVYAAGSDTIDGVAGSTGVTLTNAKRAEYILIAANTFLSAQLGAVSA